MLFIIIITKTVIATYIFSKYDSFSFKHGYVTL